MESFSAPLVDCENPLYCPEISAHQYMSSIRLFQASVTDASKFPFFHRLCNAFMENRFQDSPEHLPLQLMKQQQLSRSQGTYVHIAIGERNENNSGLASGGGAHKQQLHLSSSVSSSRSLLRQPPRRIKRSSSHIDMSFVLSAKADRLRLSDKIDQLPSSIGQLENKQTSPSGELFWPESRQDNDGPKVVMESGPPEMTEGDSSFTSSTLYCFNKGLQNFTSLGLETPKSISLLLKHLESLLPGMRLQGQLDVHIANHQDIVNLLGVKGHLNPQTLVLFQHSHIRSLSLTESMADVDGLNLLRLETLKVLNDPSGFLFLRSIVLSDVPLRDDDLAYLSHLQSLESLFLDDTQIGDIAVMHLISLRRVLSHLELSWNERITDNAIPTLCQFPSLSFLSLKGTRVNIKGLRKLAYHVKDRDKKISIILPSDCEEYMCNLQNEYETALIHPFIHDPEECYTLRKSTLKENLAVHAARNSGISVDGSRAELEKRLRKILEHRKKDLIVQGFMLQGFVSCFFPSGPRLLPRPISLLPFPDAFFCGSTASMSAARDSDQPRLPHLDARGAPDASTTTRDCDNFSLTLRPADFGDESRRSPRPDVSTSPTLPSSRRSRSHSASSQSRGSSRRRELSELAGNPFVVDSQTSTADGLPRFRQDIYPAYDANGRRIGLDHVRSACNGSEPKGYYRRHVHEYDNARGAPLPLPSQVPVQSNLPERGPLPPVSEVIAGISPDAQFGIGTFSHIQNRPRTPHEILGLPMGAPLNLWSLADPETPDAKPQYNYHVLVKLAILGNKGQKATLQDILRAIRLRFPYYANLPKQDAIAFSNSIRHLLSLLAAFVREPKPVTEPGKGSYWRVDFSKGEGNKRIRKRNKPQRKTGNGRAADKHGSRADKEMQDNRSESEDSQMCASTETPFDSPTSQSPNDDPPQTPRPKGGGKGKGGRKPAAKNLINTPNGGTAIVSASSSGAGRDLQARFEYPSSLADRARNSASTSRALDPFLQSHPGNGGAQREYVMRGNARAAPYPSPVVTPGSASSSVSGSSTSDRDYRHTTESSMDTRYRNGHHAAIRPSSREAPTQHGQQQKQQSYFGSYAAHGNNAYIHQPTFKDNDRYESASPQSPLSTQSMLSPATNTIPQLPASSSQYPSHYSRSSEFPPQSAYNIPRPAHPLSASSVPGPSSSPSNNSASYGFAPYEGRRCLNDVGPTPDSTAESRVQNGGYANPAAWNSPHSMSKHAELSSNRR
ncbi:hypothetical protein ACEPAH_8217 [Sanghuangporus vaninii]